MNTRSEIVNQIGGKYLESNIENDEFSYPKEYKKNNLNFSQTIEGIYKSLKINEKRKYEKLDIRFQKENTIIQIETKKNDKYEFSKSERDQLMTYYFLEKELTNNYRNIVSILVNMNTKAIRVYINGVLNSDETTINSMEYYENLFNNKTNDKNKVIETTNELNNLLHSVGIRESLRSQFVGSILVALNNNLVVDAEVGTITILDRIKEKLREKIKSSNDDNYQIKIDLLVNILDKQEIKELKVESLIKIVEKIQNDLVPYINNKTPTGEDLLNLFFTTFNKYVGKADKNQAYTPTHITDFMCDITEISWNSNVLDPTCGSGSFLVQAMSKMIKLAKNDEKRIKNIKANQLFGIEREDKAFGLATTNMLIHEDGKTNIIKASCFDKLEWIKQKNIDIVLMNPPFNGQNMPNDCPVKDTTKVDATKGLYFVYEISKSLRKGAKLATILPLQCAIGNDKNIAKYKRLMLENNSLLAVFSLPDELFYPGASINSCIMLFETGKPHSDNQKTFFGYFKDDGFIKRKNKGRVEKTDWDTTKKKWFEAFEKNKRYLV
ncbi:N-6 DNA methylase [Ureaplasma canigenitalium]|uniref:N-6 DNA methylase n=1 Tax=Ureaplasma canigenitalium TaxID=42092 RepID=UPI0006916ACE|nr:N-6 DNA methylase [Ureaplasma canigenitalium]